MYLFTSPVFGTILHTGEDPQRQAGTCAFMLCRTHLPVPESASTHTHFPHHSSQATLHALPPHAKIHRHGCCFAAGDARLTPDLVHMVKQRLEVVEGGTGRPHLLDLLYLDCTGTGSGGQQALVSVGAGSRF